MIYEHSLTIGQRLANVLALIRTGRHSTPSLASELGVSEPTISRCLAALRSRGYEIASLRRGHGWVYVIRREPADVPASIH